VLTGWTFFTACPCYQASSGASRRLYATGSSSSEERGGAGAVLKPTSEPGASSGKTTTTPSTPTTGPLTPRTVCPTDHRTSRSRLLRLHALYTPANISALSALGARIPHANLGEHVELVERCLIHQSFWEAVAQEPSESESESAEAEGGVAEQKRYTNFWDEQRAHNGPLDTLGNSLLGMLAAEWVEGTYPYLPTRSVGKTKTILSTALTRF
jgi:dsRNA-specific ribonuclease